MIFFLYVLPNSFFFQFILGVSKMFSLREKPSNLILLLAYVFILNGCAVTEVAVNLAKGEM